MKRDKSSTKIAGIDVGKRHLDVAVHGEKGLGVFANTAAGIGELIAWLKDRQVGRVGLEATGGYERGVREALSAAGLEVVVHQPLEVRLFARLKRLRAKNDRIDAVLIAAATAQVDAVKAAADPRLGELADRLTVYEHVADQLAQTRTFMEHVTQEDLVEALETHMRGLKALKAKLLAKVLELIGGEPDLAERLRLLVGLPGVGPVVAAQMIVRMPELGAMKRGQAACLLGVAPFDRESGQFKGQRAIAAGRPRPRRMLYIAAMVARRYDPGFRAFAERLAAKGKPPKVILVAIMRKLIEAANTVLLRKTPWQKRPGEDQPQELALAPA
jgi:transposase